METCRKAESYNMHDGRLVPQTSRHCFLCPRVTPEASGHLSAAVPVSLPPINYPFKVVHQTPVWGARFPSCQLESTNVATARPRRACLGPVISLISWERGRLGGYPKLCNTIEWWGGGAYSESHLTCMRSLFRQLLPTAFAMWSRWIVWHFCSRVDAGKRHFH